MRFYYMLSFWLVYVASQSLLRLALAATGGGTLASSAGATLGALSPAGMATNPNVRRHPKVGNNVVIYANSTLLGGATEIGDNVVVGGNAFLTSSVAPNTVVSVKNPEMTFRGKHHRG